MARRCVAHPLLDRRSLRGVKALPLTALAAGAAFVFAFAAAHGQGAFPFGSESTLEIAPLKGTKRLPTLDIDDNGVAELDLWCANMKVRLIVVADTITVVTGPKTERPCPPEQARADEEILTALAQVANWRLEEDTLVLTGGPTELRFRLHTN